jgi:hypothetical protein
MKRRYICKSSENKTPPMFGLTSEEVQERSIKKLNEPKGAEFNNE